MMTQLLLWPLLAQCILAAYDDCHWVRVIYRKMGGDVSKIPNDCCRMEGVICEGDRVAGLFWAWKSMKGIIPPEIGNLVNLKRLYLSIVINVKVSPGQSVVWFDSEGDRKSTTTRIFVIVN